MKKLFFILFVSLAVPLFVLSLALSGYAQNPIATPPGDEVLKISTTLIQVDVMVTDKDGNVVTDLKPEDFEVYENDKKQEITNFSFVMVNADSAPKEAVGSPKKTKDSILIPPVKIKAEQVKRTYALVVDDLGLNFGSVVWVKDSLKKFVNEQMREGDLVAIVRTGGGVGALQSFTSDKRQLMAAIEKIRWNFQGRSGISAFAPIRPTLKEELAGRVRNGKVGNPQGSQNDNAFAREVEEFRNENFSVGTLGSLNYIIGGMRDLPGRKAVMLFSEGFALTYSLKSDGLPVPNRAPNQVLNAMRVLADLANRSSVVIYTLDPRGLLDAGMFGAEDDVPDNFASSAVEGRETRERDFAESQLSLRYLAYETGGFPFVNQNDLDLGMRRVIADQSSYYLLGYQPDSDTFDPNKNKFNNLGVKVKRPGLKVRYRSGFFGITDEKIQNVAQTPRQKLFSALTSPFGASDINLSLYPIYQNEAEGGDLIQALVYIDAKDLKFTEGEGKQKANFDIVAMTFGDNGVTVGELSKNYTIEVTDKVYQKMLTNGFVYTLRVPIKKSGAYQFRIALRDTNSEKIGAASQFVEVPNFKKRMSLSNLILDNFTLAELEKIKSAGGNQSERGALLNTTLRKFKRETILRYDYAIYNPKRLQTLTAQMRLIRDGKVVYEENPAPLKTDGQADLMRLQSFGAITLGKNLEAGSYILQIIVFDPAAKGKDSFTGQFIEFEIVK